jgi:hypothetical protein
MRSKPRRTGERFIESLASRVVLFDLNKFTAVVLSDPHSLGQSTERKTTSDTFAHLLALTFSICDSCSSSRAVTASITFCCWVMIASCFATVDFNS